MDISIKKPCHENWNNMTPNEQGAFCGKCVKTVIDFSTRSIEEIKEFFAVKQEERICGRFEKTQLATLSFDHFFTEFKGFSFTKRLAVILYFTFGMALFNTAGAQVDPSVKGDVDISYTTKAKVSKVHQPQDSVKKVCKDPAENTLIMGKIVAPKQIQPEERMKMGEVQSVPKKPGPKAAKPRKPLPKK
jgi:hypothetical protein